MSYSCVSIAPLVLLSVVDHYKRMSTPRVIGILLGTINNNKVLVTNSFAVPFEESEDNFFLDTSYLQNMFELYYKVNCKEKIVGWYHSGPKLMKSDIEITKTMTKYCDSPILSIINVHLTTNDIPCQAYELTYGNTLKYLNAEVSADETEEVGVEHLLRDIKDSTGHTIKDKINLVGESLLMYRSSLDSVISYLSDVEQGKKPNHKILDIFQEIINSVPRIGEEPSFENIYISETINTVISLNDLNKSKASGF